MSAFAERTCETAPGQPMAQLGLRWVWWLVPVAAVIAGAAQWYVANRVPDKQTWREVIDHVVGRWQPGDGLWVTPVWHELPWSEVEVGLGEAGVDPSDAVVPVKKPLVADVIRYQRLWVVAVRPWAEEIPPIGEVVDQHVFGSAITVTLVRRNLGNPTFDALAKLNAADVSRRTADGKADRCKWVSDRFRCGSQAWKEIRHRVAQVGSTRRRVVVAHAFPDKGSLILHYDGVKLGDVLEGGVGNTMWAVRHQVGSAVDFRIWVADKPVIKFTLAPGDFSWVPFRAELGELGSKIADVRVEISADNTQWREVGFDLLSYHDNREVATGESP